MSNQTSRLPCLKQNYFQLYTYNPSLFTKYHIKVLKKATISIQNVSALSLFPVCFHVQKQFCSASEQVKRCHFNSVYDPCNLPIQAAGTVVQI